MPFILPAASRSAPVCWPSHFDMALSSATLRNEMAALTKLGLLEQPHTSAGRVPSPKGYRYYLDHLLEAPAAIALSAADRENIDRAVCRYGR